jgi:amino acid adenylation domain-containing protein
MDTPQTLVEFLSRLRKLDIQLTVEDGRLGCSAPKGVLTSDLKETLKARKAEILELLRHTGQPTQPPPIERSGPETLSSPSLGQQRLWFMEQMDPGGTAYVIPSVMRFIGSLNRAALENSVREMIRRHEVLRTSLIDVGGSPKAVVRPLADWKMEVISLPDLSEAEQARELGRISAERTSRHFDLSQAVLVRACLVEFGSESHVFLIEFHPICCDGWSLGVLTEELAELYAAYSAGETSSLPELPIQFSDFARWHRKYSENDAMRSQISYWQQKLSGSLPTIDLPSDRLRPRVMTSHGARLRQSLPRESSESVRLFSTSENVTPFITLLAAFKILLSRYTGQSDIIVGSVSAGRSRPELERLAGLFENNLALRTDLSGDPTVRELLGRVRETVLGAFSHEDVAFDHLVEILPLSRDLSRSPLFQIMFILRNFPIRPLKLPGLKATRLEGESLASRYDLTVDTIEIDGAYDLYWEYNTDLLDAGTIERMQIHYRCLLENLLRNPQTRISEIQILTPEESDHLIAGMGNPQDYPQDLCVHEWFEKQAAQTPDLVAVICGSSQLTYTELSSRSNRLAHRLLEMGIGPDLIVGVCLERSIEMAIALLAVLKAGGAYVPIDPQYPKERIALMLEDSGASVLVTTKHLLAHASGNGLRTICLDRDQDALSKMNAGAVVGGATPNNLAYVIYTSGSTGKPKGVEITHRSLVNFLTSMQREPGMSPRDRLLAVTTLSFDIAGLEFFLPLVTGAQLVIAPRTVVADGIAVARLLEESGATIMQATPITWRLLLESGWQGTPGLKILCGGESLPRDLAGQLLSCGDELWNLYGPTETTIWSTVYQVDSRPGAMPIGKPIANTVVYVLDAHRKPVPTGVAGELYIGGDGVARGYRNRPELTAEKFIDSPFHKETRLYRTGDLARWLPDGNLDWLGRADHQVKVRGYRIELGEIEAALEQQPGVKQAVVIVREDTPGDQRLTAYVVATRDSVESSWSEALRSKLPEYMIPSAFVRLEEFPLTPNRKVDRKLLPAPEGGTVGSAPYEAPRTETEKDVAIIWQELLRTPRVGINDNFFDLGGHSLLVVQLQNRLRQQFHREISLVELFQRPTVTSMASFLSEVVLQAVGSD